MASLSHLLCKSKYQGVEDTKRKVKELHGCVVSAAEVVIIIIVVVISVLLACLTHPCGSMEGGGAQWS